MTYSATGAVINHGRCWRVAATIMLAVLTAAMPLSAAAQVAFTGDSAQTKSASRDSVRTATTSLTPATRITIGRTEIEIAGWKRVAELLDGAIGSSRSSVDGFVYSAAGDRLPAPGIAGVGAPEYLIFVDGVRIAASAYAVMFTELLPVTVQQLDSVRFTTGPAIVNGVWASRGAMELFSGAMPSGFSGSGTIAIGDETGDPGPYRHTELETQNVEKIGPFAEVRVGYAARRVGLSIAYHHATFTSSDTNVLYRLPPGAFMRSRQFSEARTTMARVRVQAAGVHTLSVSRGDQFGFVYIPAAAAEADPSVRLRTVALAGDVTRLRTRFAYDITSSSLNVTPLRAVFAHIDTTTRRLVTIRARASWDVGPVSATLGAGTNRWQARAGTRKIALANTQLSSGFTTTLPGRSTASLHVGIVRSAPIPTADDAAINSPIAVGAALNVAATWAAPLTPRTTLQLSAISLQPTVGDDGAWIERYMSPANTSSTLSMQSPRPRISTIGASLTRRTDRLTLGTAASLSQYGRELRHTAGGAIPGSSARAFNRFSVGTVTFNAESDTSSRLFARLTATVSQPFNADTATERALRSTGAHEIRAMLSAEPVQDIRTSVVLQFGAETLWSIQDHDLTLPPGRRIDVSFEKFAFTRNVRVQLVFRNLLNATERYHPQGAQWNFRTLLSLSIAVP